MLRTLWYIFSLYFLLLTYSPQTPFTFGLNQRAPYTAGDRCLLCRCERKDGAVPSEAGISGQNGTSQPNKTPSALQLPLWVCSDCRRTVEKEDRHTALEQSLGVSHLRIKRFKVVGKDAGVEVKKKTCGSSKMTVSPLVVRFHRFQTFSVSASMPHICSLAHTAVASLSVDGVARVFCFFARKARTN